MSKELDNKEEVNEGKEVVSRTRGIIIFSVIAAILFGLFLYFNLTGNNKVAMPNPSVSPTSKPIGTPTPTVSTPSPVQSKANIIANGENHIVIGIATVIAGQLSERDWTMTPDSTIQLISNYINFSYLPTISAKINAWDWAGCIKTKCIIGASKGKSTVTAEDSNNIDITQVIIRYQNYKKPLPSDTWHIHMTLQADGQWRATDISGPGF